jgi:hypothetical protein
MGTLGLRIRIRIIFGSWFRIRIIGTVVKSWITNSIKVKIHKALETQKRDVDAHNGGLGGTGSALT